MNLNKLWFITKGGGVANVYYNNRIERLCDVRKKSFRKMVNMNECYGYDCLYQSVIIRWSGIGILYGCVYDFINADCDKSRRLLILTNKPRISSNELLRHYKARWGIEVLIKESKKVCEIDKSSFFSDEGDATTAHLCLRLLLYMILDEYRATYCKKKTSIYKVAESFRVLYNETKNVGFQKEFSSFCKKLDSG